MTTLTITPDIAKKRLKLSGTVASGEKVAVTVAGFGTMPVENLRLRVMVGGVAVGYFPLEDGDEWTVSGPDLSCTLNLYTEQAERWCRFGADALIMLEDFGTPQLYGVADMGILPWVKLCGVDVPAVSLDNYKIKIDGLEGAIDTKVAKEAFEAFAGIAAPSASLSSLKNTVVAMLAVLKGMKS